MWARPAAEISSCRRECRRKKTFGGKRTTGWKKRPGKILEAKGRKRRQMRLPRSFRHSMFSQHRDDHCFRVGALARRESPHQFSELAPRLLEPLDEPLRLRFPVRGFPRHRLRKQSADSDAAIPRARVFQNGLGAWSGLLRCRARIDTCHVRSKGRRWAEKARAGRLARRSPSREEEREGTSGYKFRQRHSPCG